MSRPHPKVHSVMRNALIKALFGPLQTQSETWLKVLIRDNSQAHGNTQLCVRFEGEILGGRNYHPKQLPRPINFVHRELRERFREWQQHKEVLEREWQMIGNFFATLFTQLHHPDDFCRVLPDSLQPTVAKYRSHFPQDAAVVSSDTLQAFCQTNQQYLALIKQRMARNLLLQH